MKIRNAILSDLEEIYNIEKQCFPFWEAASKEQLEERLNYFPDCFFVMDTEDGMIGFINGMATDIPDLDDTMYENAALHNKNGAWQMVFGLDVLPEYQHNGYASMLMNHLIQNTKKAGRNGVVLTCKKELLEFYQKFGFRNEGISQSVHGGAVWYQMRLTLNETDVIE